MSWGVGSSAAAAGSAAREDRQDGGAPDPGGHGPGGSGRSSQENGGGPSSGRDRRPRPGRCFRNGGQTGHICRRGPRRSVPAFWRRFRAVFLVNSGASCFSASKIPFGKMDISGRFSGKTQNVILILDQNYRKHIPGSYRDRESVETGRFPGAGLQEK